MPLPQKDLKEQSNSIQTTENSLSYIVQKLEKISNALYIITNFFPQTEPLRISLREKALSLLGSSFSLKTHEFNSQLASINISAVLDEVMSLISLAKRATLISETNADILIEECKSISALGHGGVLIAGPHLSEEHFTIPRETLVSLPQVDLKTTYTSLPESVVVQPQPQVISTPKKEIHKEKSPEVSGLKKRRREAILSFIKDKGEVGIKEISREVRGCSQKTIQRELVELVDQGVINRRGERRWSIYSLKSNLL